MSNAAEDAAARSPGMVDWDLAAGVARRIAGPGPSMTAQEVEDVVARLRSYAREAEGFVAEHTGLVAPSNEHPVRVVDRSRWARANASAMQEIVSPVIERLQTRAASRSSLVNAVGPRVTGVEVGAMLGYLASKVLGQYDPFGGQLLLVAPNIVEIGTELRADERDFALWVCLHEETHRVQFTAVDWLSEHMRHEVASFLDAAPLQTDELLGRLADAGRGAFELARSRGTSGPSLLDLVQTPEQREVLDRLGAMMSLLEGHAEVVMDGVGPEVVPSVASIRSSFQQRRGSAVGLGRMLRRLLGLDAKLQQYADGSAFVNAVVERVGMDGFNAVFTSPETLPSATEVAEPRRWLDRVHG